MNTKQLKMAAYEQPRIEMVYLVAETSLMLTTSGIEEGTYEEEEVW